MQPRFYHYNGDILPDDGIKAGIIAQEFQKIIPEAVVEVDYQKHNFDNEVTEEGSYLAVNTDMIRYALVNAIQDQHELIENLQKENQELRQMVEEVISSIAQNQNNIESSITGSEKIAVLNQNNPNPFNESTAISYFIPESSSSATITITSNSGQVLKTIDITNKGEGVLNLSADNLPDGNYHYTLSIDGKTIETNTMVLVK